MRYTQEEIDTLEDQTVKPSYGHCDVVRQYNKIMRDIVDNIQMQSNSVRPKG